MEMMYTVYNTCGGIIYRGKSLDRAINEATTDYYADPYVYCKKGKRPVIQNDDDSFTIGEFGKSYDDLLN